MRCLLFWLRLHINLSLCLLHEVCVLFFRNEETVVNRFDGLLAYHNLFINYARGSDLFHFNLFNSILASLGYCHANSVGFLLLDHIRVFNYWISGSFAYWHLTLILSSLSNILSFQFVHDLVDALIWCVFWESLNLSKRCFFKVQLVFFTTKHALMMNQNFLWKTFKNPFMLQWFERCHPVHRVPVQTLVNKVQEFWIWALSENTFESFSIWDTFTTTTVCHDYREEWIFFKKQVSAGGKFYDVICWYAFDLHYISKLLCFIFTWK